MAQAPTEERWPPGYDPTLIWYAETETFNIAVLKQSILVRGFTPESLAHAAGLSRGTVYNALTGRRTRIRTARRILESLSVATPAFRLSDLSSIG